MIFSKNPEIAEQQMIAIIVYLTTFGYIDGNFDLSEKVFILNYIRQLVEMRVNDQGERDEARKLQLINGWTAQYDKAFEQIDAQIRSFFDEVVADNENLDKFVYARLKLSCFELFKAFDPENQRILIDAGTKLIAADGKIHPNEERFRQELVALLKTEPPIRLQEKDLEPVQALPIKVNPPVALRPAAENHPLLELMEKHYSRDQAKLREEAQGDYDLITQTLALWEAQRKQGAGRLAGKHNVAQLAGSGPWLDGHVYGLMPKRGEDYELIAFGDLHGCYSCLKGALLQADFFTKVANYRKDPARNPNPKLVFIGDYIDRGQFSFNGILRTILQLFVSMPEHVYILRGNHEYYLAQQGRVNPGVRPAEAIATMESYWPLQMFEAYRHMFESMPNILLFDKTIFVHAGIARDELLYQRWKDLGTLNDPDIRFQMMWSDPSRANFIPAELQRENARFPFGKNQFRTFMNQIGCATMIRGHEKIDEGFKKIYDEPDVSLLNLFSAGGRENADLPPTSSYRTVTPMALTIRWKDGQAAATPFAIDWQDFQVPQRNAFFRSPPEIAFRQA
jgi:calcineurin-like phosphoesterase family protein